MTPEESVSEFERRILLLNQLMETELTEDQLYLLENLFGYGVIDLTHDYWREIADEYDRERREEREPVEDDA